MLRQDYHGAGEMAHQLRSLNAPAEDLSVGPSTHVVAHVHNSFQEIWCLLRVSLGIWCPLLALRVPDTKYKHTHSTSAFIRV